MAISQEVKDKVAKLLDNLNIGTKKAAVGQQILALIEEAAASGGGSGTVAWADISNKPTTFTPPAATASAVGGVKQGAAVTKVATPASATAEQVATTLNSLIDSLKTSGATA